MPDKFLIIEQSKDHLPRATGDRSIKIVTIYFLVSVIVTIHIIVNTAEHTSQIRWILLFLWLQCLQLNL